jgi:hypothetical protein
VAGYEGKVRRKVMTDINRELAEICKMPEYIASIGELKDSHAELLNLHKILLCPAECPPIAESDGWEVKALKCIIQDWHRLGESRKLMKKLLEMEGVWVRFFNDTWYIWYDTNPDSETALDEVSHHANYCAWLMEPKRFCALVAEWLTAQKEG